MVISIKYPQEIIDFMQNHSKKGSNLVIDVKITQEACLFGAEPIINFMNFGSSDNLLMKVGDINDFNVFITPKWSEIYPEIENIELELKGKRKKKIICTNPKPIIKNICKVEKK